MIIIVIIVAALLLFLFLGRRRSAFQLGPKTTSKSNLSTIADDEPPTKIEIPVHPSYVARHLKAPLPTNGWPLGPDDTVPILPYMGRIHRGFFAFFYPTKYQREATSLSVIEGPFVQIGTESRQAGDPFVHSYDAMSCSIVYPGSFIVELYLGSPFITVKYMNGSPVITPQPVDGVITLGADKYRVYKVGQILRFCFDFGPEIMKTIEPTAGAIPVATTLIINVDSIQTTATVEHHGGSTSPPAFFVPYGDVLNDPLRRYGLIVADTMTNKLDTSTIPTLDTLPRPSFTVEQLNVICCQWKIDSQTYLHDAIGIDPYNLYALMQLYMYADLLHLDCPECNSTVEVNNSKDMILTRVSDLLDHLWTSHYVYDTVWGGMVRENDQSYANATQRSGYIIYAAAMLAHYKGADWFNGTPSGSTLTRRAHLLFLVRNVVNPTTDSHFPLVRDFDFYLGRAWGEGPFEMVNCYVAAALVGDALNIPELGIIGRVCAAAAIKAAHYYYGKNISVVERWKMFWGKPPCKTMVPFSILLRYPSLQWLADTKDEQASCGMLGRALLATIGDTTPVTVSGELPPGVTATNLLVMASLVPLTGSAET